MNALQPGETITIGAKGYTIGTEVSTGSPTNLATEASVARELASENFDVFGKMDILERGTYRSGNYLIANENGQAVAIAANLATEAFVEDAVSDAIFHEKNQRIVLHEDRTEGADPEGRDNVVPSESYLLKRLTWHTSVN